MKKNHQIILLCILILLFLGLSLVLYPTLPARLPMQWGLDGKVNYTLPKLPVVVAMNLVDAGFGSFMIHAHRNEAKIDGKYFVAALLFPILFAIVLLATQIHF